MSNHTPGPWIARQCGKSWAIDFNEEQEQVEDVGFDYGVNASREAIQSTGLGIKVK